MKGRKTIISYHLLNIISSGVLSGEQRGGALIDCHLLSSDSIAQRWEGEDEWSGGGGWMTEILPPWKIWAVISSMTNDPARRGGGGGGRGVDSRPADSSNYRRKYHLICSLTAGELWNTSVYFSSLICQQQRVSVNPQTLSFKLQKPSQSVQRCRSFGEMFLKWRRCWMFPPSTAESGPSCQNSDPTPGEKHLTSCNQKGNTSTSFIPRTAVPFSTHISQKEKGFRSFVYKKKTNTSKSTVQKATCFCKLSVTKH